MKLAMLALLVTVGGTALQIGGAGVLILAQSSTAHLVPQPTAQLSTQLTAHSVPEPPAQSSTQSAVPSPTIPDSAARVDDLLAIEATVNLYLDGGKDGDLDKLRRAFHERARLQFVKDGQYSEWSIADYLGRKTPGKRSGHETRILSVDFAGSAAVVKAELDYGQFEFIDFLNLLEIEGEWKIVNKLFYRAGK